MRILIDIGHPAHVHYFKNFAKEVISKGSEVLFTCRDKEVAINLLEYNKFEYVSFGKNFKSKIGKIWGLFYFTFRIFLISLKYRPDMYLNASMYAAIVAWILRKPHISLEDTFNNEQVKLYMPFTSCVLTGDYEHPPLGKKEITYKGYQELLYLHPNVFQPDRSIYSKLGLLEDEPYIIVRFVAWNASHDYGHKGISDENKILAVKEFSKYGRVFVSSESDLPEMLEKYRFKLPPHEMHDALAHASMIYGESSTMVSECAVLGVPGIFIDNTGRFYTRDQEKKYDLVYNFTESDEDQRLSIQKGIDLLSNKAVRQNWRQKKENMLSDKIDVTAFMVWFIENYPESVKIMKENPDYQHRFK